MFEIGVRVQTYSQLGTVSDTKVEYRVYQVSRLGEAMTTDVAILG